MTASTTVAPKVELRRSHLVALIVAAAALTAAITWLLVAVAFDPGAPRAQQSVPPPGAVTPVTADYPPDYRGMP